MHSIDPTNMTNSPHIAVLAFPFGTHAPPLLTLVRRLATVAPDARFSFFGTRNSNAFLFSGPKPNDIETIKAYNIWDGTPEGYKFLGNVPEAVGFFLKATPENFDKGIKEAEAETGVKISCLISDAFLWFGGAMAEKMGVPWVAFWTAGSCSLSVHIYTDLIRSKVETSDMTENAKQALTFIPGMSAIQTDDLPEGVLFGNLESPFAVMLHNMGTTLSRATAVVINSFEELDSTITKDLKSKLQNVLNVGPSTLSLPPLSKSDETGCLLWLDKQKSASVAYISFRTVVATPPNELTALAEALETVKVPFLWSFRDDEKHLLPKGFLERTSTFGKIVSWAPQLEVLSHTSVGIFVTHCGWNSIMESISYVVPMICRPIFAEQKLNSRLVEDVWKIGVTVEGGVFTKSSMLKAIDHILSNENGKQLRENIGVLKELAIKAVRSNGSSANNFSTLKDIVTSCKCT